ncbi:MAG: hypothetical protein JWM36_861 [Hyphomicrobiales bacterium]|nr:hypothetical protein [Hyphomicrobiales bacterium]
MLPGSNDEVANMNGRHLEKGQNKSVSNRCKSQVYLAARGRRQSFLLNEGDADMHLSNPGVRVRPHETVRHEFGTRGIPYEAGAATRCVRVEEHGVGGCS